MKRGRLIVQCPPNSPGSVLVDYFVELSELGRTVSTADMKRLFHESLLQSTVNSEALTAQGSAQQADYAKLKLGSFDVDPKFTDFVGKSLTV